MKRYEVLVDVVATYRYLVAVPDDSTPSDSELLRLSEDAEPEEQIYGNVRVVTARCLPRDDM